MISEELLLQFNAELVVLSANQPLFHEGNSATYFFQIKTGSVKMYNLNEDGKEFVQGIFYQGQSFGEPPLFGDFEYPAGASTLEKTEIYRLSKQKFLLLLQENFETHLKFTGLLAKRMSYKAMILKEISVHTPEHRILTLVDFLKEQAGSTGKYQVALTRQQIANLTGLRVETVIRGFKQLEIENKIEIINRKIYR